MALRFCFCSSCGCPCPPQNGRKVTRTTTTQRFADGREETRTEETVDDVPVAPSGGRLADAASGRARLQDAHTSGHRHAGPGFRAHVPAAAHREEYGAHGASSRPGDVHHYSRHLDSQHAAAAHGTHGTHGAHVPSVRTPAPTTPHHMSASGSGGAHGTGGLSGSHRSHTMDPAWGGASGGSGYGVGGRSMEGARASGSSARRH